ncbi:MAG: hypothetical protein HDS03_09175 [Bacteroides sp.]|nr:hypothetical protein [Bacteroides sp.]MDE7442039.1 hypothetical protein [Muribaculaceae bacterium]
MDTRERDVRENNERKNNFEGAEKMAEARRRERSDVRTRKMNRLWMWLGVVILVFLLLVWIFGIGTFEDLMNVFNG